jgi:ABC-2 type transport system permease protein
VDKLPAVLQPLAYLLPLTYGVDLLHGSFNHAARMPTVLSFGAMAGFCTLLFLVSLRNVKRRWIG